jgi:putative transposase
MHAATSNTLNLQRHLISRRTLRTFRRQARADWNAAAAAAGQPSETQGLCVLTLLP